MSAVVLAAGRSTRMGREKALLEVDGAPLWEHQRDILAGAGAAEIFLSVRPDQKWARGSKGFSGVLHDALPDCGPLVGLTAALERAAHPWVAVLAIDLPRMTPDWFVTLRAGCEAGTGAVGRREGYFEPLAAIYPRAAMFIAWEALARAEYSLQGFIGACVEQRLLQVREIGPNEAEQFTNWNEPHVWSREAGA